MIMANVQGLSLQFDLEGDVPATEEVVRAQIEIINTILSEQCSWSQPQILIDEEKFSVEGVTLEE